MAKDILSMYGSDASSATKQVARADCGGYCPPKELPYSPPVGPKGQMEKGPGLHGTNHGNAVNQGRH
jgi:hypothetical protein